MAKSELEEKFYAALVADGTIPMPIRQYAGIMTTNKKGKPIVSRHRIDFAWLEQRVSVEIEGGAWTNGRHTRGSGFVRDCTKYNLATLQGWRILRFTVTHLEKMPIVLAQVKQALSARE
jgi:very-short-patch-repair endonuclease